jgi:hypothetical protein
MVDAPCVGIMAELDLDRLVELPMDIKVDVKCI